MALTKKREIFCKEYVKTDSASDAYRLVFSSSNMKPETVNNNAYKLLQNNEIITRVAELKKVAAGIAKEHFQIDSKEILGHLNILRQSSIDQYVNFVERETSSLDADGNKIKETVIEFKPFDQLTKEQLMCIESIKHTKFGVELKLHGKDWTIEKIAKHIGFYEKDNNQRKPPAFIVYDARDKDKKG